jgi:nucleotide-binding universal stress UspA family protein
MRGTIVCGVSDTPEARCAAQLAEALAARLDLRLVLVHVIDGVPAGADDSLSARQRRQGAERMLRALRDESDLDEIEARLAAGDRARALANVAAEEGADLVVVGSRRVGLRAGRLESRLARELASATPVPVVVAPPSERERTSHRLAVHEEAVSAR